MLSTLQPNLECVPGHIVWSSFDYLICKCRHHRLSLCLGVADSKTQEPSLVLRVEFYGRRGHDKTSWAFPLDEARLHALRGLLHSLVADTPLRKERAHQVGGELPAHPCGLVDDQEAVF